MSLVFQSYFCQYNDVLLKVSSLFFFFHIIENHGKRNFTYKIREMKEILESFCIRDMNIFKIIWSWWYKIQVIELDISLVPLQLLVYIIFFSCHFGILPFLFPICSWALCPHLSLTNYCVSLPLWEGYWKVIEDIWSRDVNSTSWEWRHLNISFVVSCPSNIFLSCLPCSSIFNCISFWTWMEKDPTIAEICRLYQCCITLRNSPKPPIVDVGISGPLVAASTLLLSACLCRDQGPRWFWYTLVKIFMHVNTHSLLINQEWGFFFLFLIVYFDDLRFWIKLCHWIHVESLVRFPCIWNTLCLLS